MLAAEVALYPIFKQIHVTTVVLSLTGFLLRFAWRIGNHPLGRSRATRIWPHVNDSVLLVSGLAMAYLGQTNPLTTPWLAAKLFWLIIYIIAGSYALKRCPTRRCQWFAFAGALAAVLLLLGSAIHRSPFSWLAVLTSSYHQWIG